MDDKQKLEKILLNTLTHDTSVVRQSQKDLEQLEGNPLYPVLLAEIINSHANDSTKLDMIAVLSLTRLIRNSYKYYEIESHNS
jgi:hypothetical protein